MKKPTDEQLVKLCNDYFSDCEEVKKAPTKAGLLLALDIVHRKTYNEWKKKSNALKKAELAMEDHWNQRLRGSGVAGACFYLKNAFGYRDKQDHDITSGGKPIPPFDYTKKK